MHVRPQHAFNTMPAAFSPIMIDGALVLSPRAGRRACQWPRARRRSVARPGAPPAQPRPGKLRYPEQSDALGSRKQRAHEFEARLTQETVASDHCREAAASGDLAEVGKLRLHRHCPAVGSCLLAPGPDVGSHGLDPSLDIDRSGQVALEGGLGAGRLALTVGNDGPVIVAVCDAEIPRGRFPEMLPQEGERLRFQICAR
jgi:hypothetical protein